jgi:hypothetical protein
MEERFAAVAMLLLVLVHVRPALGQRQEMVCLPIGEGEDTHSRALSLNCCSVMVGRPGGAPVTAWCVP